MLIKRTRTRGAARQLAAFAGQSDRGLDRRNFLAPLGARRGRPCDAGHAAARQRAQGKAGPPPPAGAQVDDPQEHLHPLRRRLYGHRRSRQRRVDRPGAELGQPDQPRLALRQGRLGAGTRLGRAAAQISAEAGRRPMDPHLLGPGGRRDRRQAVGDPRQIGAGFRSIGWARPNSPTRAPTCSASSAPSGGPTTPITRRGSAIRRRSPGSPIPGAMAR